MRMINNPRECLFSFQNDICPLATEHELDEKKREIGRDGEKGTVEEE